MNYLTFPSDATIHALGWVLLHSLWQGTLLALLVLALRYRLPHARHRYWLAYGALMAMLLAAVGTFFWQYEPAHFVPVSARGLALPSASVLDMATGNLPPDSDWMGDLAARLETWHPLIVNLWILGLALLLLRLAGGWWWLAQLRRRGTTHPAAEWMLVLERLLKVSKPGKRVDLLLSIHIKTPMTLGFFKPIILIPMAMINQISPAEVEAVLAHELAHIMRHDWLFNILQSMVETLFYYHPAAWWLSAMARQERENSCDDAAVALTGQRLVYAKALLHVQEIAQRTDLPALALAFTGPVRIWRRRPALLQRIQRLLQPQQQKIELMEKWIATAIIMALIALWGVRSGTMPVINSLQAMVGQPMHWLNPGDGEAQFTAAADSVPKPKRIQKIQRDDGKQKVEMEVHDGAITRLNVDGREIPPAEYEQYEALTDDLMQAPPPPMPPSAPNAPAPPAPGSFWETPAPASPRWGIPAVPPVPPVPPMPPGGSSSITTEKDGNGNTIIRLQQFGEPVEIVIKDGQVLMNGQPLPEGAATPLPGGFFWHDGFGSFDSPAPHADMPFFNEHQIFIAPDATSETWRMDQELRRKMMEEQRAAMEMNRGAMEQQRRELEMEMRRQQDEWKKQGKEWKQMEKEQQKAMKAAQKELEKANWQRDAELAHARAEFERAQSPRAFAVPFNDILRERLLVDGLITNPNKFDFKLSGKELRVNGKKCSDEMHDRYLDLYRTHFGRELGPKDDFRINEEE